MSCPCLDVTGAMSDMVGGSSEIPLLEDAVPGAVDYQGYPAKRSSSGGWRSAYFIVGEN